MVSNKIKTYIHRTEHTYQENALVNFCVKTASNGCSKIHSLKKLHKPDIDQII